MYVDEKRKIQGGSKMATFKYWFVPFTGMSSIAEHKQGGDTVRCLQYEVKPTAVELARLANLGLLLAAAPEWDHS
jgi:hypothetical protein|tara:strand:- start:234 stop:458 length:225 start_codon:yes stop_codon:yes gene_type:complete